jgi:DNA-binding NarL/FixJ family response regulator
MVKPRILVVEDDAIVTAYLERALQQMQYEIIALLATGEAAVEQARVRRPDVVLMDIKLAGKLTGLKRRNGYVSRPAHRSFT